MARITVEDCLTQETNRFALVLLAAKRTKQILQGSRLLIDESKGNKPVVNSLREIAAGRVRFMTPEEAKQAEIEQAEREAAQARAREALAQNGGTQSNGQTNGQHARDTQVTRENVFAALNPLGAAAPAGPVDDASSSGSGDGDEDSKDDDE